MGLEDVRKQWVKWASDGELPARLAARELDRDDTILVTLHNEGALDLLSLVEAGQFEALPGTAFFAAVDALSRWLPELDTDVNRLMAAVESLVARGGTDLAAGTPNAALRAWLERRPNEAARVIASAASGDALAARHLTFALEALNDASRAREFVATGSELCCLGALTALSRITDSPEGYAASLAIVRAVDRTEAPESTVEAHAFLTAASLYVKAPPALRADALEVMGVLLERYPDTLAAAVVHALWLHSPLLEAGTLPRLLERAITAVPEHPGTVGQLDEVARRLMAAGRVDAAAELVQRLLERTDKATRGQAFPNFRHALLARPSRDRGHVAVQWLLNGSAEACEFLHEILGEGALDGAPLEIDEASLPSDHEDMMFLCGRAIGWLMFVPVSATSVLCAAIRATEESRREDIGLLLSEMLFQNYHCAVRHARTLCEADPAWSCLQPFLDATERHIDAWKAIPDIPELAPSDEHRRIQHLKRLDEMRDVHKATNERSFFASFFKRSVVLYGSGMITMVREDDGSIRRVDVPMTSFSVSKEVPRQYAIDPIGFDETLRTLRFGSRPT